jgi:hypothetical protein
MNSNYRAGEPHFDRHARKARHGVELFRRFQGCTAALRRARLRAIVGTEPGNRELADQLYRRTGMTRHAYPPITVLLIVLGIVLVAAGCGDGSSAVSGSDDDTGATSATTITTATTITESPVPEPTAEIMAVAAQQLVTVDHTFGSGPSPFSTFLVQDRTDPAAGSGDGPSGGDSRPLTDAERSAIERRLSSFGEVLWIDDSAEYRTSDLAPTVEGAVIIGLGEPAIDADTALAPVSLWCGGLCGTWFTYSLARDSAGEWAIEGIDGPVAIS